ncbi:MAG: site-specific integrase [Actinobacteria bacterium]|nr:site-specific integrase [Actinomycetota bacterium]
MAVRTKRSFGAIRRLPSKRYQASYVGPDLARHTAPDTFTARIDAEGWLANERRLVEWDEWISPERRRAKQLHNDAQTLRTYASTWLPERTAVRGLKPKTVSEYGRYLDRLINPSLGDLRLKDVTPATVRAWIGRLNPKTPRLNEHAYSLLKSIFATAVQDEVLDRNPCRERIRKPIRHIGEPASLDELALLVATMPERLRLMIELAAWCALRFGEVAELRRGDIDLKNGVIRVTRAVQWVDGVKIVAAPKADSVRVVAFPPHLADTIRDHLKTHAQWGRDGLLFPTTRGEQHRAPTFHQAYFRKAREAAGRPDLRFHDLRQTGATLAAASGATLAELMQRLGHTTVSAALAYQHSAQGSDKRIAARLSLIATSPAGAADLLL